MASKIHTDNPKHHKYVTVNKRERKKEQRRVHPRLSFLIRAFEYVIHDGRWCISFHRHHYCDIKPNNRRGTVVVFDDCNHKTYRVLKRSRTGTFKFVKTSYYGREKHFKRNSYYGYL